VKIKMSKLGLLSPAAKLDKPHTRLSARDVRANLSEAVDYVTRENNTIVLTKHGQDSAGIVPIEEARQLL
jgi:prevent-host-death family protein